MIQANELRIGNWIYDAECEPHYFKVEQIRKHVGSSLWVYYRNGSVKAKDIEPIPLTPEVLEKCHNVKRYITQKPCYFIEIGFISFIELEDCQNGMFCVYIVEKDKHGTTIIMVRTIEYLHQLQNLYFALTGEELDYKP